MSGRDPDSTDQEDDMSEQRATYSTRDEAIQREIVEPIEAGDASRDEFDIDAIAAEVIVSRDDAQAYECAVDEDEFWQIVAKHERMRTVEILDSGAGNHLISDGRTAWCSDTWTIGREQATEDARAWASGEWDPAESDLVKVSMDEYESIRDHYDSHVVGTIR